MTIRHREASRLEGFSDAVFGFALTLLVVALETPKTFDDLQVLARQFVPFALTFAMVCWIWYEHNIFFRRYGLQDALTVFINCVLLFVVLFYVYPLKFLAGVLVGPETQGETLQILGSQWWSLMLFYSLGVFLIFSAFIALHWRAWGKRDELALNAIERMQLKFRLRSHSISVALATMSLLLLFILPAQPMWAGVIYALMGPFHGANGYMAGKAQDALKKSTAEL